MPTNNIETTIQDLTLLLLYLTSWTEQHDPTRRSWKGYTFEALDALAQEGYIRNARGSKSAVVTDDGVAQAKRLLAEYGIPVEPREVGG